MMGLCGDDDAYENYGCAIWDGDDVVDGKDFDDFNCNAEYDCADSDSSDQDNKGMKMMILMAVIRVMKMMTVILVIR